MFLPVFALAQTEKLDAIFEKYQEAEGVTSIKIAKPMFRLLNNINIDDSDMDKIKPLISKMNGLKILIMEKPETAENPTAAQLAAINEASKVKNEILAAVKNLKYDELMTLNSKDNKIKFLAANTTSDILDNLLLTINGEDSNVMMMLDGKISMNDVSNLVNDVQEKTQKPAPINDNISSIRNVEAFHGIDISSGVVVDFTQGNDRKVEVIADADKMQYVKTKVENGILKVSIDRGSNKNLRFKKLMINIQNPNLDDIHLSSGSIFKTKNKVSDDRLNAQINSGAIVTADLEYNSMTIQANSGSVLTLELNTKNLDFSGNSGMIINAKGIADTVSFKLNSGASCNAQDLITKNMKLDVNSGAIAKVNANSTLEITASSGAIVQYKGNPEVNSNIKKSNGAIIRKID